MIATNVVSLVKKIVKTGDGEIASGGESRGSALSKLKQSVASGIQGLSSPSKTPPTTPTKLFNKDLTGHLTEEERRILEKVFEKEQAFELMQKQGASGGGQTSTQQLLQLQHHQQQLQGSAGESSGGANHLLPAPKGKTSGGECRICRKLLAKDEPRRICDECKSPICEDCASYTSDSSTLWRCSLCRRRCTSVGLGLESHGTSTSAGIHRVPSVRRMEQGSQRSILTDLVSHTQGVGTRASFMLPDSYREALIMELEQQRRREEGQQDDEASGKTEKPNSLSTSAIAKPLKRGSYSGITEYQKNNQDQPKQQGTESAGASPTARRDSSRLQHRNSTGDRDTRNRRSSFESTAAQGHLGGSHRSPRHSISKQAASGQSDHYVPSYHQQYPPGQQSHEAFSDGSGEDDFKAPADGEPHLLRQTSQGGRQKSRRRSHAHKQGSRGERRHPSKDEEGDISDPEWQGHPDDYGQRYDQASNRRCCSSESSDISDVSGDYSTHSERSGCTYAYYKAPLSPGRKYAMPTQVGRSYDGSVPVPVMATVSGESTPSPMDEHMMGCHGDYSSNQHRPPQLDRNNSYDAAALLRKSIPIVTVDCASENFSTMKRGYSGQYMNMFYNDGYSGGDMDQPRRCSTGSALPRMEIPENQLSLLTACHPHGAKSLSMHSLDLPRGSIDQRMPSECDLSGFKGKPSERRASAPEGDNIRIVIDDMDSGLQTGEVQEPRQRRLILRRDQSDTSCRTRGFGMRLVGGKRGQDGRLYAVVSWVLLGSSADTAGLQKGTIVLEWNGQSLVDKTFEEVSEILDQSGDPAEITVETGRRLSPLSPSASSLMTKADSEENDLDGQLDQPRAPPIRRKSGRMLPRLPGDLASGGGGAPGSMDEGEMCIQLFYDEERSDLVVRVLSVRGLAPRKQLGRQDAVTTLHRAYVKLRLSPDGGFTSMKTPVSDPAVNPEWNKSFVFPSLQQEELNEASLKLSVWEHQPTLGNQPVALFLGDVVIPLRKVLTDPDAVSGSYWYRLRCERDTLQPPI